jgi:hypothetical protein
MSFEYPRLKDNAGKGAFIGIFPACVEGVLRRNKYLGGKEIEKQKIICDSDISVLHVHINASSCFRCC